jgi:hypothetical protein
MFQYSSPAGALSCSQVQRLLASWESLGDDWTSSPFFHSVGEHSRAYIDQLRKPRTPSWEEAPQIPSGLNPSEPQRRPIPHV